MFFPSVLVSVSSTSRAEWCGGDTSWQRFWPRSTAQRWTRWADKILKENCWYVQGSGVGFIHLCECDTGPGGRGRGRVPTGSRFSVQGMGYKNTHIYTVYVPKFYVCQCKGKNHFVILFLLNCFSKANNSASVAVAPKRWGAVNYQSHQASE